jgi:peptidoglycan/LPS O-acetylase OafA/YrhL
LHPVKGFYLRRIFRIVPLFYVLLIATLLRDWCVWHRAYSVKEILLSVCMLFNLVPGHSTGIVAASWTIGVEMLFYLMFPLVIKAASGPLRLALCFIATMVLAFLFVKSVQHSHISIERRAEYFSTSLAKALPVFVLGLVTYAIFTSRFFRQSWPRWAGAFLIAIALVSHLVLAYSGMYFGEVGANCSAPAWMLLVLGLAIHPIKPLVNTVTRFYGQISYSVYLNHPLVVSLLIPFYRRIYQYVPGTALALLACLAVTFLVLTPWAYLTYRVIEQPGIRFGSRLIKSLNRPGTAPKANSAAGCG